MSRDDRMDDALALEDDVRAALEAEIGPLPDRYDGPLDREEGEADESRRTAGRPQRLGCLYPIAAGEDLEWRCVDCGEAFDRGFGGVDCVEPTCAACVAEELHRCAGDAPPTQEAVGARLQNFETGAIGVSSEVVRTIERTAIERLRGNRIIYDLWRPSAPASPLDRYQRSCSSRAAWRPAVRRDRARSSSAVHRASARPARAVGTA